MARVFSHPGLRQHANSSALVAVQAARNLGELASQMTARVDQLALDLASKSSDADTGKARAYLTALRGVLANAGSKLTGASLPTLCETFNGLVDMAADNEELHVRNSVLSAFYVALQPRAASGRAD